MKYPRELQLVFLPHNLGASIDGVYIGHALGRDVEICGRASIEDASID